MEDEKGVVVRFIIGRRFLSLIDLIFLCFGAYNKLYEVELELDVIMKC